VVVVEEITITMVVEAEQMPVLVVLVDLIQVRQPVRLRIPAAAEMPSTLQEVPEFSRGAAGLLVTPTPEWPLSVADGEVESCSYKLILFIQMATSSWQQAKKVAIPLAMALLAVAVGERSYLMSIILSERWLPMHQAEMAEMKVMITHQENAMVRAVVAVAVPYILKQPDLREP
jgi:hypothetical protein